MACQSTRCATIPEGVIMSLALLPTSSANLLPQEAKYLGGILPLALIFTLVLPFVILLAAGRCL